jgi:hypothetical protein
MMSYAGLLTQQATYWAPQTPDGVDVPAGNPVAFVCRWQDKQERRTDSAGREYISRAIIYTTSELQKDGWVYRGTTTIADPVDEGAFRVRDTYRTQDPGGGLVVWKIFAG